MKKKIWALCVSNEASVEQLIKQENTIRNFCRKHNVKITGVIRYCRKGEKRKLPFSIPIEQDFDVLIVDRWETTLEGDRQALSQLVDYIFLKYNAALVDAHYSCVFIPDSENVGGRP